MYRFLEYNNELYITVKFGYKKARRFIKINDCYEYVGKHIALALPFFRAFSGPDATTSFYRKSKVNMLSTWMNSGNT